MNKKITFTKIAALGLISTSFALTNVEIVTSKSESIPGVALQVDLGKSANAGVCNSRCVKGLARMGGKAVRTIWRTRKQQQQQE